MSGYAISRKVARLLAEIAAPTVAFTMLLSIPLIVGTSLVTSDMELVGFLMRHLWVLSLLLAALFSLRYLARLRRSGADRHRNPD
jgi:membrane protein implicated in regulation of membrane protease activity